MGTLRNLTSGEELILAAGDVIGRSQICQLRVEEPSVSSHHARFDWTGAAWTVRDLGSRNGTYVDGRAIEPGEVVELRAGMELEFARPGCRYRLIDASPPGVIAISDAGEVRRGDGGVLCLPSEDEIELTVYEADEGRWMVEAGEDLPRPLDRSQSVRAGGREWRIQLPGVSTQTRESGVCFDLQSCTLVFSVSRNGEHVELRIESNGSVSVLEARAHLDLLLELARTRASDAEGELPESEHGWVYRDELARRLGVQQTLINLWTHRARRQFADLGIRGAEHSIERRAGTSELRLGTRHFTIHDA